MLTAVCIAGVAPAAAGGGEAILLLHGLARDSDSMEPLARHLSDAGYDVHNLSYPSTTGEPKELVGLVRAGFDACCTQAARVHFVTHSLGAILTRMFLNDSRPVNLGRVVMIAPPNRGSEIVDLLGDLGLFRRWFGPTGSALTTDERGLTHDLPAADYEVGVIAGDWPVNPLGAVVIPGRDDGGVSVDGTKLEGMADFLTVHRSHGRLTSAPEVAAQALYFIKTGSFDQSEREVSAD